MTASLTKALSKRAQEEVVVTEDETPEDLDDVLDAFLSSNPPEDLVDEVSGLFAKATKELEVFTPFPKVCGCGITYATLDDFLKLPFKKQPPTSIITADDAGLGCYQDIADYDLLHRDCSCRSTLVLKVSCIHTLEQKAVDTVKLDRPTPELPAYITPQSPTITSKPPAEYKPVTPSKEQDPLFDAEYLPSPDLTEDEVKQVAQTKPAAFLANLARFYPWLERLALENLVKQDPKVYFLLQYHNDPKHRDLAKEALEHLIQSRPDAFFNLGLFTEDQFKGYLRSAMHRLLAFEPQVFFGDLQLYDYPELTVYRKPAAFAVASKKPAFFLESVLPYFPEFHSLKQLAESKLHRKSALSKRAGDEDNDVVGDESYGKRMYDIARAFSDGQLTFDEAKKQFDDAFCMYQYLFDPKTGNKYGFKLLADPDFGIPTSVLVLKGRGLMWDFSEVGLVMRDIAGGRYDGEIRNKIYEHFGVNRKASISKRADDHKDTIYWAVKLDDASKSALLDAFPPKHPNVFAEHTTIAFKAPIELHNKLNERLGEVVELNITGYAEDDKGQAVAVSGVEATNGLPHVTISCADGTKPVYSKTLLQEKGQPASGPVLKGVIAKFTGSGWVLR